RRPYSVILFDEIEKAHPDVFNVLLQILDEGRLTDSQGRTVDFRNTVLIMTSNLGAHAIQAGVVEGQPLSEEVREDVMGALRENFRPEFINRIDEIVLFEPLARAHLTNIVELQLDRMRDLLRDRKLGLEVTPAAREVLAERGYDPVYGARPLKRAIQKNLQDPLAMQILQGAFQPGDTVKVDAGDEGLTFSATNEKEAGDKDADAGAPPPLH